MGECVEEAPEERVVEGESHEFVAFLDLVLEVKVTKLLV